MRSARSKHDDVVAGAGELLGGGQPGRARSRRRRPACRSARSAARGVDPALVPGPVDDLDLDLLDRDRVGSLMPSTHAASHGAGHSRPVNSGKLLVACSRSIAVAPVVAVDEVVPVGDQVAERAAVVAERDAAVHAARRPACAACRPGTARRPRCQSRSRTGTGRRVGSSRAVLHEPGRLTHARPPSPMRPSIGLVDVARRPRPRGRLEHPLVVAAASPCGTGSTASSPVVEQPRRRPSEPVSLEVAARRCRAATSRSSSSSGSRSTISRLTRAAKRAVGVVARRRCRRTCRRAKLRPVGPSTTTRPPVMYSQPWSPTPSTTAVAPELRTQNRSPTTPRRNTSPPVAP